MREAKASLIVLLLAGTVPIIGQVLPDPPDLAVLPAPGSRPHSELDEFHFERTARKRQRCERRRCCFGRKGAAWCTAHRPR